MPCTHTPAATANHKKKICGNNVSERCLLCKCGSTRVPLVGCVGKCDIELCSKACPPFLVQLVALALGMHMARSHGTSAVRSIIAHNGTDNALADTAAIVGTGFVLCSGVLYPKELGSPCSDQWALKSWQLAWPHRRNFRWTICQFVMTVRRLSEIADRTHCSTATCHFKSRVRWQECPYLQNGVGHADDVARQCDVSEPTDVSGTDVSGTPQSRRKLTADVTRILHASSNTCFVALELSFACDSSTTLSSPGPPLLWRAASLQPLAHTPMFFDSPQTICPKFHPRSPQAWPFSPLSAAIRLSATHPLLHLQGRGAFQLPITPTTTLRTPPSQECAGTLARWSSKVLRCLKFRTRTAATSGVPFLHHGRGVSPPGPVCGWVVSHGTSKPQSSLAERETGHQLRKPGRVVDVRSDECVEFHQHRITPLREFLPKFRSDGSHHKIGAFRRAETQQQPRRVKVSTNGSLGTKTLCAVLFFSDSARMNRCPKINMNDLVLATWVASPHNCPWIHQPGCFGQCLARIKERSSPRCRLMLANIQSSSHGYVWTSATLARWHTT